MTAPDLRIREGVERGAPVRFRFDELVAKLEALNARLPVQVLTFAPDNRCWELLRHGG